MDLKCKKEACKFKVKENGYCGKHQRTYILENALKEGKRLCDVYRGCFTELLNDEKKCKGCREKAQALEKISYNKAKVEFLEKIKKDINNLKCRKCKSEYTSFTTSHNKASILCLACYEKQKEVEKIRIRDRNYQEEAKRNIKSYWLSFCRIAKRRNKDISLVESEFINLVNNKCYYCNYINENEVIGVDRLDNNKGYILDNCVPCCKICNRLKHIYHPSFFIEKAKIINSYIENKVSPIEFYKKWNEYIPVKAPTYKNFHTQTTKKRNIEVNITEEDYNKLTRERCYLCGFQSDKGIGLDRVDSESKEYSLNTIKPCCGSCNMMKADISLDTVYTYMKKISENHITIPDYLNIPKTKFLMGGAKQ
jgi:hypothetical protein